MTDIHIEREHRMTLAEARAVAALWVRQAEDKFDMRCTSEKPEGVDGDTVSFTRSGVSGSFTVNSQTFEVKAQLGFLLGAFKERIQSEIVKNLDALLSEHAVGAAPGAVGAAG